MRRHCRTDDHPRTNPPPATTRRRHTTRTRTVRPRAHHHEDKVDKSTVYGALSAPITPPPQAKAARWRVSMRLLTTTIHLVTNPAGPDTTNSPSGTRPRPARNPTNWTPMRRHSRTTAHSVRVPTGGTTSLRRRLGPPVAPPGVLLHRKPADPEDARTWGVGRRAHDLDDGIAKSTVYGALSAPILLAPVTSAVMWTPVRRHCRTTAHSVKVSARQGVPGTEGSSGAAGFDGTEGPGGIPEGQGIPGGGFRRDSGFRRDGGTRRDRGFRRDGGLQRGRGFRRDRGFRRGRPDSQGTAAP